MTGPNGDLVCVRPSLSSPVLAEVSLSPVCSNPILAAYAFFLKRLLVKSDKNLRGLDA